MIETEEGNYKTDDACAKEDSHPAEVDDEEVYKRNFSDFCRSIGPSEDINGNRVWLSMKRKTRLPVKPQLHKLDNPMDPKLKCTTCDKQIDNS